MYPIQNVNSAETEKCWPNFTFLLGFNPDSFENTASSASQVVLFFFPSIPLVLLSLESEINVIFTFQCYFQTILLLFTSLKYPSLRFWLLLLVFLAVSHGGMWDPSSLIREWYPGPHQWKHKSPNHWTVREFPKISRFWTSCYIQLQVAGPLATIPQHLTFSSS